MLTKNEKWGIVPTSAPRDEANSRGSAHSRGDEMTRMEFETLVLDKYGISADYPFTDDYESGVFRHTDSGKWFAIAMSVGYRKLGVDSDESVDIVNLKCPPEIVESIVGVETGVYPAYHMNKLHWLTATLDGSCNEGLIEWLLGISYDLTKRTMPRKSK